MRPQDGVRARRSRSRAGRGPKGSWFNMVVQISLSIQEPSQTVWEEGTGQLKRGFNFLGLEKVSAERSIRCSVNSPVLCFSINL